MANNKKLYVFTRRVTCIIGVGRIILLFHPKSSYDNLNAHNGSFFEDVMSSKKCPNRYMSSWHLMTICTFIDIFSISWSPIKSIKTRIGIKYLNFAFRGSVEIMPLKAELDAYSFINIILVLKVLVLIRSDNANLAMIFLMNISRERISNIAPRISGSTNLIATFIKRQVNL